MQKERKERGEERRGEKKKPLSTPPKKTLESTYSTHNFRHRVKDTIYCKLQRGRRASKFSNVSHQQGLKQIRVGPSFIRKLNKLSSCPKAF